MEWVSTWVSTRGWRSATPPIPTVTCMNLLQILLIAAVVIFVMVRRFTGQPVGARSLAVPLGLTVWGALGLRGVSLSAMDVAFLAVSLLVGLAAGAARGATIQLFVRDGQLWQRYRLATLGVWLMLILVRIGLTAGEHAFGAHVAAGQAMLVTFGLSLVAESLVVGRRAMTTGVPLAPARRGSRIGAGYR